MATIVSTDVGRARGPARVATFRAGDRLSRTKRYYDRHAGTYAAATMGIDVGDRLARFASMLPPGGRVLDAGCGAGRDLAKLASSGLDAWGLDMSGPLAEIARRTSGRRVVEADLRSVDLGRDGLDGIWAMASLLHLDRSDLPDVLSSLAAALRRGGLLFASVKRGAGEVEDDTGRWFTLHDEAGWAAHLEAAGLEVIELVGEPADEGLATGSVTPGWISSLARRPRRRASASPFSFWSRALGSTRLPRLLRLPVPPVRRTRAPYRPG